METTITHALKARTWAAKKNPAHPQYTNFEWLMQRIEHERAYHMTIMRNQVHTGFDNNYWPTLSRLAIMQRPDLVRYIHPRDVPDLDDKDGARLLVSLYMDVTGRYPAISNWQQAKKR
jgi:DNA phosphorothioation-dependent restriction protein DptG